MKKLLAFILTLAAVLSTLRLETTAAALPEKLLRLHVLAASDSENDQALKLRARDAVMEYLTPLLDDCRSREEAERIAAEMLPALAQIAANAAGQRVSVALVREKFDMREYGGFALPAGEYSALRIELENGAGANWWCVVFPPLCAAVAEDDEDAFEIFDDDEKALITGSGRVIKFRLLEWISALRRGKFNVDLT